MACDNLNLRDESVSRVCEDIESTFRDFKDRITDKFSKNEYEKLYFNVAYALYQHYRNQVFPVNLDAIKKYLNKSIKSDSHEQFRSIEPQYVLHSKYILQSSCDVYLNLKLDSDVSNIQGSAVVIESSSLRVLNFFGYDCYYIENGKWLVDESKNKIKHSIGGFSLDGLKTNQNSKIIRKKENYRQIEIISLKAQHKRGKLCVNSEYYHLKRKCKKLKQDILFKIKKNNEAQQTPVGFFQKINSIKGSIEGYVKSLYEKNPKELTSVVIELVQTYIKIGMLNKIDGYLKLFKEMFDINPELKPIYVDFISKRNSIEKINKLLSFHEKLIDFASLQNDVEELIICRANEGSDEIQKSSLKLEEKFKSMKTSNIVFIEHFDQASSLGWKAIWFNGKGNKKEKVLSKNEDKSLILKYLNTSRHKRVPKCFHMIFIDDKDLFNNYVQSRNLKLIESYKRIKDIYEIIGHLPFKNRYEDAIKFIQQESDDCRISFIRYCGLENNHDSKVKYKTNEKKISIFNNNSISFIKKINDKMTEKEFFGVLSNIDKCKDFQNTFNSVEDIDILVSKKPNYMDKLLKDWQKEYSKNRKAYTKKYLLILVECEVLYQTEINKDLVPQKEGNLIVIKTGVTTQEHKSAHFIKNGIWVNSKRTGEIKAERFQDASQIEALSNKYHLRRWYIYCEEDNGRVLQGFLENFEKLQKIIEILKDFLLNDAQSFQSKKVEISKALEENLKTSPKFSNRRSDQFIKSSEYNEIEIFNFNKPYHLINLKNKILSSHEFYVCVVKISTDHFISLVTEPKVHDNSQFYRKINIINSKRGNSESLKKLSWLECNFNNCSYKLNEVKCPPEQPTANNSFLHAYINSAASKWALENNHWVFLKENLCRQNFSSSGNIEILKMHSINLNSRLTDALTKTKEKNESFIRLEELFKLFYKMHISRLKIGSKYNQNNLDHMKQLIHSVDKIDSIKCVQDFIESFEEHKSKREEFEKKRNEIKAVLDLMAAEKANLDVVIDMLYKNIQVTTLEVFERNIQLIEMFEMLEKKIHEVLLRSIVENNESVDCKSNYLSKINLVVSKPSSSKDLLTSLINISSDEIKELANNILIFYKTGKNEFDSICNEKFENIKRLVNRFYELDIAANKMLDFFGSMLPLCFELLELKEINIKSKTCIYDKIGKGIDKLDDIFECVSCLLKEIKQTNSNLEITASSNTKIDNLKEKLNAFLAVKDEITVYTIGIFMRQRIVRKVEDYVDKLLEFRYESTKAFEAFEKDLNKYLIQSVSDSEIIKTLEEATKIFSKRKNLNLEYGDTLNIYKSVINLFRTASYLEESIKILDNQLNIKDHLHSTYISQKLNYLADLIDCFHKITRIINDIGIKYSICLADRYDNLTNEEVFDEQNGKIYVEILSKFQSDCEIIDIARVFKNKELENSILKIYKELPKDNKIAAWCLRETIFHKTKDYVNETLDFRQKSFICFDQFEKELFKFLSEYDKLKNVKQRSFMKECLEDLKNTRDSVILNYTRIMLFINAPWCQELRTLLEKCKNKLNPYIKSIYCNLRNLLNNYVNWYKVEKTREYDFHKYKIKTTSAILSEIINNLNGEFKDCFCPNNEIQIINTTNLYVDIDLIGPTYTGMKIVMISPTIKLVNGRSNFTINVSGKDADDVWFDKKAKNLDGHDDEGNGFNGIDGSDGKPGSSAGHVYIG
jgi:hypothetical protein